MFLLWTGMKNTWLQDLQFIMNKNNNSIINKRNKLLTLFILRADIIFMLSEYDKIKSYKQPLLFELEWLFTIRLSKDYHNINERDCM